MKEPLCLSMDFLGPRDTSEVGWGVWWDVAATCFPLGPAVACDDPDGFPASLSALEDKENGCWLTLPLSSQKDLSANGLEATPVLTHWTVGPSIYRPISVMIFRSICNGWADAYIFMMISGKIGAFSGCYGILVLTVTH